MLASVIQQPISAWTYLHVRNILLVLAEFLAQVESTRSSTPTLAAKLRDQISRIDKYMQQRSQCNTMLGLFSIGQSLLSNQPNIFTNSPFQFDVSSCSAQPYRTTTDVHIPQTQTQSPVSRNVAMQPQVSDGNANPNESHAIPLSESQLPPNPSDMPPMNGFDVMLEGSSLQNMSGTNSTHFSLPSDLFDNWPLFLEPGHT